MPTASSGTPTASASIETLSTTDAASSAGQPSTVSGAQSASSPTNTSGGLSQLAKVGIGLGVPPGLIALIALAYLIWLHGRNQSRDDQSPQDRQVPENRHAGKNVRHLYYWHKPELDRSIDEV